VSKLNGFRDVLELVVTKGATDLHVKVPSPPVLRIDSELVIQEEWPPFTAEDIEGIFEQITTQEQRDIFNQEQELDFSYSVAGLARFRVNVLRQRGTVSLAFRRVPSSVPTVDELGLPQVCKTIILKPRGLILVTGPAGSGKSTTLAAMLNHLNENATRSVITIEDPIEYLFQDKKCLIRQRDMGDDTKSFSAALVHALRHDPDVIVIGEMRDLDTISTAITAAETGHLVLATLHTLDAAQSIDRIIDVFTPAQQRQMRLQLSQVIEAVLSQTLLPRIGGGRVAAFEVLLANNVIRRLIREEKIHEISASLEMGKLEGMNTLDQALAGMVKSGVVAKEEAVKKTSSVLRLEKFIQSEKDTFTPSVTASPAPQAAP
jgi:twitching motility protein PilT